MDIEFAGGDSVNLTKDGTMRRIVDRHAELKRRDATAKRARGFLQEVVLSPSVVGNVVTLSCPMGAYAYEIRETESACTAHPVRIGVRPIPGSDPDDPALAYAAIQAYLGASGRSGQIPVRMSYRSALHTDGMIRGDIPAAEREMVAALMRMDRAGAGFVETTQLAVAAEIARYRMEHR